MGPAHICTHTITHLSIRLLYVTHLRINIITSVATPTVTAIQIIMTHHTDTIINIRPMRTIIPRYHQHRRHPITKTMRVYVKVSVAVVVATTLTTTVVETSLIAIIIPILVIMGNHHHSRAPQPQLLASIHTKITANQITIIQWHITGVATATIPTHFTTPTKRHIIIHQIHFRAPQIHQRHLAHPKVLTQTNIRRLQR